MSQPSGTAEPVSGSHAASKHQIRASRTIAGAGPVLRCGSATVGGPRVPDGFQFQLTRADHAGSVRRPIGGNLRSLNSQG